MTFATFTMKRTGLTAAVLALAAAAACSNKAQPIDGSLKADLDAVTGSSLELAPTGGKTQMVVSSIEEGPEAAPAHASPAPVTKPAAHALKKAATHSVRQPAPAPAPRQTVADVTPEPQPVQETPVQQAPVQIERPAPAPVQRPTAPQRQPGTYKTEAEIFRQMPWIRP